MKDLEDPNITQEVEKCNIVSQEKYTGWDDVAYYYCDFCRRIMNTKPAV